MGTIWAVCNRSNQICLQLKVKCVAQTEIRVYSVSRLDP